MPDGVHSKGRKDKLMRLPMGELSAWDLVCSCGACRADRYIMVSELVGRSGPDATLVMLLPRLRCREAGCRQPPGAVVLRSKLTAATGGPAMVSVELINLTRL